MADSNKYDQKIKELEDFTTDFEQSPYSTSSRCLDEVRRTLARLGMNRTYRDRFAALTRIKIYPELSKEQEDRLVTAVGRLTESFYTFYSSTMSFTDESISWMGRQMEIILEV